MEVVRLVNLVASYHPLNTPTRKDGGHQVEENKIDEVQHAGTHRYKVDENDLRLAVIAGHKLWGKKQEKNSPQC
jgi:hypothetical protein